MSDVNEKSEELLASKCTYAAFICSVCEAEVEISLMDVHLLVEGKSVGCQHCKVTLNASADDQASLAEVHEDQVRVGKFMLPFSVVWFSVAGLVAIFLEPQFSLIMMPVGLVIGFAIKNSSRVIHDAICLEQVTEVERDIRVNTNQ